MVPFAVLSNDPGNNIQNDAACCFVLFICCCALSTVGYRTAVFGSCNAMACVDSVLCQQDGRCDDSMGGLDHLLGLTFLSRHVAAASTGQPAPVLPSRKTQ